MESRVAHHLSPSSIIQLSPALKTSFHEELRPRRRVRTLLSNHSEDTSKDAGNIHKPNLCIPLRPKVRKSATLNVESNRSTNSLTTSIQEKKNLSSRETNPSHTNSQKPRTLSSGLTQPHQINKTSDLKETSKEPTFMTKKGYDVNLVRQYMKRKRKENKFMDHTELLKDIFKPLHQVCSPPRPSTPAKEVKQKVKIFMTQRKKNEKRNAFLQSRAIEEQKKKRKELLAALEKERRLKLQQEVPLMVPPSKKKKRPLVHEKISSALNITSHDDKLMITPRNPRDSQSSQKKNLALNTDIHHASLKFEDKPKRQVSQESNNAKPSLGHPFDPPFQTPTQTKVHPMYLNHNQKDNLETSLTPNHTSYQSPLPKKVERSPMEHLPSLTSPHSHANFIDSTFSSIFSMQIPTPSSATYGSVHSTLEGDEWSNLRFTPTELWSDHEAVASSDPTFPSSTPSPIKEVPMDHAQGCPHPQGSDYYRPFRIYSRLVTNHGTQGSASTTPSDPGIHYPSSDFVDLSNTDFKKILRKSDMFSATDKEIKDTPLAPHEFRDELKILSTYQIHKEFGTNSTPFIPSSSSSAPLIKSIPAASVILPIENSHSSETKPMLPTIKEDTMHRSSDRIDSTHPFQAILKCKNLKKNEKEEEHHEDLIRMDPSLCKLISSPGGLCRNNNTGNECMDQVTQTDPFFEQHSNLHFSPSFRSELKKMIQHEIQTLLHVQLDPLIQEIERKLHTLQALLHSVSFEAKKVESNTSYINDQPPVPIKNAWSPLPFLPPPVPEHHEIKISNLSPVQKIPCYKQELTSLNIHDTTGSSYPEMLPTPYEETYISTNAGATMDSNSIFDFSQFEGDSLSHSCLKLTMPLPVPNDQSTKLGPESFQERGHSELQTPSACFTNSQSSLSLQTEEVLELEPIERSETCSGLAMYQPQMNLIPQTLPNLDVTIHDVNLGLHGWDSKKSKVGLSQSEIEEESRLKSSPISSQGLEYTEVVYSDTFISEPTSMSDDSSNEEHFQPPSLKLPCHSSIDGITTGKKTADSNASPVFTEEVLCESSNVSLSLHTESIFNSSALSSLSPITSIQGVVLDLEPLQIEDCEDSGLYKKNEKEKFNSFLRQRIPQRSSKNENYDSKEQEINEQITSSVSIEKQESIAESKVLQTYRESSSSQMEEQGTFILNESTVSVHLESILSSIESTIKKTDQNLMETEIEENMSKAPKNFKDIETEIKVMNPNLLSKSSSALGDCVSEHIEETSYSFTEETEASLLNSHISDLNSDKSNKNAHLLEENNSLVLDEDCLSDSHFSLSSILNTKLSWNDENEENAFFNLNSDDSLILLKCEPKKTAPEHSKIDPIYSMTSDMLFNQLCDMDFLNKEELKVMVDRAVHQLIQTMIQETAESALRTDKNATVHLSQFRDMEYAEQYMKFLLLHHHSSITKETKIEALPHPLFNDCEYNHLLANIAQEFQSEWFRRPGSFLWQKKSVPACILYRALIRTLQIKPKTMNDQIASEIQREDDSIHLIHFASFFDNKLKHAVTELVDQLIDEATFF